MSRLFRFQIYLRTTSEYLLRVNSIENEISKQVNSYTQNIAMMKDLDSLTMRLEKIIKESEDYLDLERNIYEMNIIQSPLDVQEFLVKIDLQDLLIEQIGSEETCPILFVDQKLVEILDWIQIGFTLTEKWDKIWRYDYKFTLQLWDIQDKVLCNVNEPLLIEYSQLKQKINILLPKEILNILICKNGDEILTYFPKIHIPIEEGDIEIHINDSETVESNSSDITDSEVISRAIMTQHNASEQKSHLNLQSSLIKLIVLKIKLEKVDYGFEKYERSILCASMKSTIAMEFKSSESKSDIKSLFTKAK